MIYGYGEDSLTLSWLQGVGAHFEGEKVILKIYRPSLGRRHGFGEPDFLIVTLGKEGCSLWVGESKWPLMAKRGEGRRITPGCLKLGNPFGKRRKGIGILVDLLREAARAEVNCKLPSLMPDSEKTLLKRNLLTIEKMIRNQMSNSSKSQFHSKYVLLIFRHRDNIWDERCRTEIQGVVQKKLGNPLVALERIVVKEDVSDKYFDADTNNFVAIP